MMQRLLAVAIVGACFLTGGLSREATAGVSGNTFDVTVYLGFRNSSTDFWIFDGEGNFYTENENYRGTYTETDFRFISSFEATASSPVMETGISQEPITVEYSGFSFGNVIFASGSSSEGTNYFVIGNLVIVEP
jgi:hypothetical protein